MNKKVKKLKVLILLLIGLIFSSIALAQNLSLDSMKEVLITQQKDTNRANTLIQVSTKLFNAGETKEALPYLIELVDLSEKLKFNKGLGLGYFVLILFYNSQNNYVELLNNSYKALIVYKEIKDSFLLSETLQQMGNTNYIIGDTIEALKNYKATLAIRKKINNNPGVSQTYNAIGEIYCIQGRYSEAMTQHLAALDIIEVPTFKGAGWEKPYTYQCIGKIYESQGDEAKAVNQSKHANQLFAKALDKYETSYKLWAQLSGRPNLSIALADLDYRLGSVNLKLGNFGVAEDRIQRSLKVILQADYKEYLNEIYLSLSQLDSARGNYKSAYENYKLYTVYKRINSDEEVIRRSEGFKMRNQFAKKETELKLLYTESELQKVLAKEQNQKKNLAYVSIGLILGVGTYSFYRFRKRKRTQNLEALSKERLRISQELHDEVGATLSGISMYSHLTKEQIRNSQKDEVEKSLNIMQQSAGDMVNKLNDIVWLINPEQDTLQKLIQRLEEYAGDMAAIKNMKVKFSVPQKFSTKSLPVESRRNIYLFCKEAINNAVKYSEATLLQLTVKENIHLLEISVGDNGKGFNVLNIKRGNGLDNMHKRAQEIGGDFEIRSEQGGGCIIFLQLKIKG